MIERDDAKNKLVFKANSKHHESTIPIYVDEIFDSRGTCGECKHWADRFKDKPEFWDLCIQYNVMKSPTGYCDAFEREEES